MALAASYVIIACSASQRKMAKKKSSQITFEHAVVHDNTTLILGKKVCGDQDVLSRFLILGEWESFGKWSCYQIWKVLRATVCWLAQQLSVWAYFYSSPVLVWEDGLLSTNKSKSDIKMGDTRDTSICLSTVIADTIGGDAC